VRRGERPRWVAEVEGEVEDVAEPECEGEADDGAHDHGDGLDDSASTRT
jgi:hypothetical protein